MIDIHCHILPAIDDGSQNIETTLEMCRIAIEDGITTIIASPHHLNGTYRNVKNDVLKEVEQLQSALEVHSLPIQIVPGAEIYMDCDLLKELRKETVLSLNNGEKYLLLELPRFLNIEVIKEQLFEVKLKGLIPIISHPERCPAIMEDLNLLYDLIDVGSLTQITSSSITGVFGKKIKKTAETILKRGMGHFIASDAHDSSYRIPVLSEAYEKTRKLIGENESKKIFFDNPKAVLQNIHIEISPSERPKKSFFASMQNAFSFGKL